MNRNPTCVLGLHPSSRGFGWILLEGPLAPFDWGTADIRKHKNARGRQEIASLLDKYQPHVLALETFEGLSSRRAPRIRALYRATIRRARLRGIELRVFSRDEIHAVFMQPRGSTRESIAALVAEQLPVLRPRLPRPRKIWVGEHPNHALFCAAACALAYYARGFS